MEKKLSNLESEEVRWMELSVTGRMKRAQQITKPQGQAQAPKEKTRAQARREDRLALSKQALAMLEEKNRQERERKAEIEEKKRSANAEIDAATKALKKMMKCQKIAARIMAGDKVPPEDEKYLMDNDPESYKLAIAMRKPKEDPKEWDSVLEDEDKEGASSTESVGDSGSPEASSGSESVPAE